MSTKDISIPQYGPLFRRLLDRLGVGYALTRRHYQQIGQVDGDCVLAAYVPARQQPGRPVPFRLEWRRQTGGEAALRRVQVAHGAALEARFHPHRLEWDYKPGRIAALLHLWYDGPDDDAARIAWAAENAPRFIAALKAAA